MIEILQRFEWWFATPIILAIPFGVSGYMLLYRIDLVLNDKKLEKRRKNIYISLLIILSCIVNIPFIQILSKVFDMRLTWWQFCIFMLSVPNIIMDVGLIYGYLFLETSVEKTDNKNSKITDENIIPSIGFILFCLFIFLGLPTYSTFILWRHNNPAAKIEYKIEQMHTLRQKLYVKNNEIVSAINDYKGEIGKLRDEIQSEREANEQWTYEQAKHNPKIVYDLSLIQRKMAYATKLNEVHEKVYSGILELDYLAGQSADDLKIVKVLKGKEIDDLVKGMNIVLEKYMPDAKQLEVEINENNFISHEEIWEYMFGKPK